jgi:hypothetical protein
MPHEVLLHLQSGLEITKQPEPISSSKNLEALSDEELVVIEKKYLSQQIGKLSNEKMFYEAGKLILKIAVITGWVIPVNEVLNVLIDQLAKKLKEGYGSLNVDEIEYAFRGNTSVKDWGKEMNLNLIDQVLQPYLDRRNEVSAMEQRLKERPPDQRIYTEDEILNQRRAEIETTFQAMKQGYYPIIHVYFDQVLRDDGLLKEGETAPDFLNKHLNAETKNIYVKD